MSVTRDQARRRLGAAVEGRAAEVARRVLRIGRDQGRSFYEAADAEGIAAAEQSVLATTELGTQLIGRWLRTGHGASPAQLAFLAGIGKEIAHGQHVLADVLQTYFTWGDVTTTVARDEAAQVGADHSVLAEATAMIQRSCRHSITAMVSQFDLAHQALRVQLATDQARLQHLAHHDPLTGLPNRRHLLDRLAHMLLAADDPAGPPQQVGVFYLDVDRFKQVNDTFGHDVGDRLLQAVAHRVREHAHPGDTVARLGGDEFLLVCPHVNDQAGAEMVVARLHHALSLDYPENALFHPTTSIGFTLARPGDDPVAVIAAADAAMYRTRRATRAQA